MERWKKDRLVNLTTKIGSGATPKGGKNAYKESGISLFRSLNVYDGQFKTKNLAYIDELQAEKLSNVVVEEGDVLLNITGASIARCCVAPPELLPARVNQHVSILRPKNDTIDSDFLAHLLASKQYKEALLHIGEKAGATRQALTKSQLQDFEINIPPLPEQKRIVAILDEAFTGIDAAVANTEKNLANARELFESYLNAVFTQKGDGWTEKTLQEILTVQPRNGWSPPAKNHSDSGASVLTLSSVTGFHFDGNKRKFTNAPVKKDAHYWLNDGDFLITRSNTPQLVGHVAICTGLTEPTICCDLIMKMQVDSKVVSTKFLYWYFRTTKLRELITGSAQGANPTMKKINKKIVQNLPVTFPVLLEQNDIASKIDVLYFETQRLETIYQKKLKALTELKQSILQKSFAGELTALPDKTLEEAVA